MKTTKTYQALLTSMLAGKLEGKKQQDYLFKILNSGNDELITPIKVVFNSSEFEDIELSQDQNDQAINWLKNLWVTPNGKERKNNPFGYREQEALTNFSHCTLKGYYDAGNYLHSYYVPMYDVYSKEGYGFEYYMAGGEIQITG